jgi:hypothetical protein
MERSESGFFMILFSLMWLLSQPGQAVDTFGKSVGSPLAGLKPMRHQACYETSRHNKHRVQVEPGVFVEVLDWKGKGEPLVLLAGRALRGGDLVIQASRLRLRSQDPCAG